MTTKKESKERWITKLALRLDKMHAERNSLICTNCGEPNVWYRKACYACGKKLT